MLNKDAIAIVLEKTVNGITVIYGDALKSIRLYGSYARGDYEEDSDMDIFVLVDLPAEELVKYSSALTELSVEIGLEHDILLSIHDQDCNTFAKWQNVLPFYGNVLKEGVILSA